MALLGCTCIIATGPLFLPYRLVPVPFCRVPCWRRLLLFTCNSLYACRYCACTCARTQRCLALAPVPGCAGAFWGRCGDTGCITIVVAFGCETGSGLDGCGKVCRCCARGNFAALPRTFALHPGSESYGSYGCGARVCLYTWRATLVMLRLPCNCG